uniref:BTB domain-containing protein n=1 Tax=Brassica oleracea TaxID=3712 RepID=A0A3P6BPW3_BRAOL|nr:unnamed protein product [Brassica oleracea]
MACMKLGSKSDAFQRQGQAWFCTTGLPSDVVVEVGEMSFHLHKFPLLSRSGVMERNIAEASQEADDDKCLIQISDLPGGDKTFELIAKFCYGVKLELTASNVVHLRCAAEHLEMTEEHAEGNLISQTETFLNQVVLKSWKDSLKSLQTCSEVSHYADELNITKKCIESLAVRASTTDPNLFGWPVVDPMQSPGGSVLWNGISTGARVKHTSSDWWYEDASTLSFPLFKRLITVMDSRGGVREDIIAGSLTYYTRKHLPGLKRRRGGPEASGRFSSSGTVLSEEEQKHLLEEIQDLLPVQKANLEKRIGMQLDQAALEDLVMPSFTHTMETLYDVDSVQRILDHFLGTDQIMTVGGGVGSPCSSVDDGNLMGSPQRITPMTAVSKLIDGYLAEVAPDVNLKLPKFQALAGSVPECARLLDDGLYRAIDIYLKHHPWLAETERENLCRLLDCQKLSLEACTHAAQNDRLPLRVIVQVLFFEQLQLRTSVAGCFLVSDNLDGGSRQLRSGGFAGGSAEGGGGGWASAVRENQVLKVGMDSMRMRVCELEKECSNMRQEIEKLGKTSKVGGGGKTWENVSKKLGFGIKLKSHQMCSAQEGSVSKSNSENVKIEKLKDVKERRGKHKKASSISSERSNGSVQIRAGEMDRGDIEEAGGEEEFPRLGGGKYRPVGAHDRAVVEMSSVDPGSSSSTLKNIRVVAPGEMGAGAREGPIPEDGVNGHQKESKLELFGFDSLVNILGLKSMTGEQIPAPSSPRDGEDISIMQGHPKPALKMGTMMGVFVPCLQNILGIIYYIRFTWIVGMAGIGQSLVLVLLCGLCTFLTTISLSAIATNGAMKGGGPYYLIGRALGPEVGISIGLCFFLGNAVAGALYVLGAVETFLKAFPAAGIFRETITKVNGTAVAESVQSPSSHDLQIYGIVVTILLCFIVFGGVKMINRVAPAFLLPVLLSILCIFIGMFLAKTDDPDTGITGLRLKSFRDNWSSAYQMTNNAGIPDPLGGTYWSFNELVGLFFPAVTGIMAGSNRSASLKDTQRSIPVGTLAATLSTTLLYVISVLFFGAVATRDKLLTDRLLTATVAWPLPLIVHVGIILSTLGAALQSLTGAPRLLAAIANDDILPILNYFKVADTSEPHIATLFTALICIGCVVIGNLDLITPTVTMFYLLCYAGVNLSCFLLDLLDAPSWRPRWKYHHWSLSFVGASLCIVIMFLISWLFTVIAIALASLIYKYVGLKGKAGDWGDGFKSAYFQLALRSLRSLGADQVHPKNWYPIPLVFCRPWGQLPENVPCHPKLADFANCMKKKGRGMSIFVSILDGDYYECAEEAKEACKQLATYIEYKRCEGVAEIVVAPNMTEGFRGIIQTMGLGNLKPNIVVMRYPEIWRRENLTEIPSTFVGIINDCITANKGVVIIKGLEEWPNEYQRQYGTIDLYWIVRDGGLMLLLSQLLLTKESFESCKIQLFCIAEEDSDAEALKADVKKFLYDLRMQAEVIVVTMKSWDIRSEGNSKEDSLEAFDAAQRRISDYLGEIKSQGSTPRLANGKMMVVNEQQVEKFLYTMLKLNSTILSYSRMAAVVLVSLPPPPLNHPAYFYMEYMDLLVENVPRMLIVRGYHKDVVTLFT